MGKFELKVRLFSSSCLVGYKFFFAGLIFLVYWLVAMDGADDRFQNIRKLRGESVSPVPGQTLGSKQMAFFRGEEVGFLGIEEHT